MIQIRKSRNRFCSRPCLALDTGLVGWILDCPDPGRGLFAVEVLCVVCHRMHHEAGACPHRRREVKRAA